MSGIRRRALVVLLTHLLAAEAGLAAFLHLRDRLPTRLAIHFDGERADGFCDRTAFLVVALALPAALAAVFAALSALRRVPPAHRRGLAAIGSSLSGLFGYFLVATLCANADVTDAAAVRMPAWHVAAGLGAAAVTGGTGWLLGGGDAPPAHPGGPAGPVVRLPLADGESAVWTHVIGSRALPFTALGTLALAVPLGFLAGPLTAVVLIVIGLPLAALSRLRVTVDRRGLTLASTALPRPRLTIPTERILDASRRDIGAWRDFGGWGYRAVPGASGLVLRSGEALSVRLTTGGEFVVTVDDAATAAALLNTLAARARTAAGA
ncbi:hypothetical protein [Streptomyces caatingaensis]|uniref:DUF1648 domain-containing protein n=1 Tax=Streptomyces caatingaensis TaxID=1678637 RepID=A0A0K9XAE4_9ACTN|nr:hypothetical protein [Streptomyces caatingaensis]KNB50389.1 hypothetical protein AC230_22250 [Streptomyces caatingaensis]